MALPGLELTSSNDSKTARGTRQMRWSIFTLTATWATSTDQRREARVPKTSALRPFDQFTQAGMTESRKAEWTKWKQFNAVYPVLGAELEQLLAQGHKPIPLQWIEIEKNEHKRREGGPHVAPLFKSRSISRGDLEETTSPTCDIEGLNPLLSCASCQRLSSRATSRTPTSKGVRWNG